MKALIGVVLAAGFGTVVAAIWVGSTVREEQVVDNPYEAGLAYDADRAARAKLGWTAKVDERGVHAGRSELRVSLWDGRGAPLDGAEVKLSVSRPQTSRGRASAPAVARGGGVYAAELDFATDGIWDVAIEVRRGEDRLVLERAVVVAPAAPAAPPRESEGGVADSGGAGGDRGASPCDLARTACTRRLGDGATLELDLAPRPLRTLADLAIAAAVRDADGALVPGAGVAVSFSMPGMFMGENRVVLASDRPGELRGKGVLVRCPSGRKDWRADVAVARPGMPLETVSFEFQVTE